LPLNFLRDLLRRATDAVRERLMALAPPELQEEIMRVLKAISAAARENARDFSRAEALVKLLNEKCELNQDAIVKFAETKQLDEVAASLAVIARAPTEMMAQLLEGPRSDLILIPCKAAGLSWLAVERILCNRPAKQKIGEETLKVAERDYRKLTLATSQRTLRFWQVHNKLEK